MNATRKHRLAGIWRAVRVDSTLEQVATPMQTSYYQCSQRLECIIVSVVRDKLNY